MKKFTVKGKMERAHGKPLSELQYQEGFTPVASAPYEGSGDAYTSIEEVKAANAYPSDKQVVKLLNTMEKNKVRAASMAETLDRIGVIKPTLENDDQLKLKNLYDVFISVKGTTEAEARQKAADSIGVAWADDDDE